MRDSFRDEERDENPNRDLKLGELAEVGVSWDGVRLW